MKLLFLTQFFPPEIGASPRRMWEFVSILRSRGHRVVVVAEVPNYPKGTVFPGYKNLFPFQKESYNGVCVYRTYIAGMKRKNLIERLASYFSYMFGAIFVSLFIRDVDVVFATTPSPFNGLAGKIVGVLKRKSYILDVRDLWPEAAALVGRLESGMLLTTALFLSRMIYRGAERISVAITYFADIISCFYGVERERIYDIPNFVYPEALGNKTIPEEEIRERYGIKKEDFNILYLGNIGIMQGVDILVDVAERVKQEKDITITVIGEGVEKERIRSLMHKSSPGNIRFFDGVPQGEVTSILKAFDLYLVMLAKNPVNEYAFPAKLVDAMFAGIPIVCAMDGYGRTLLQEHRAAYCVPAGDADAMTEAILFLKGSRGVRDKLAYAGKRFIHEPRSRDALSNRIILFFEGNA